MKSDITFYQAFSSAVICSNCLAILNPETILFKTCPRCNTILTEDDYVLSVNKSECFQKALQIQSELRKKRKEQEFEKNGNIL